LKKKGKRERRVSKKNVVRQSVRKSIHPITTLGRRLFDGQTLQHGLCPDRGRSRMKISEAFGDGSRERESAKDDGAEIFHRRLSLSVSRQMPVSFERSCCVPPGSFCLHSVCALARTCSLLEGHERGSGGWKKMKKGKREVSFLDLQRCQRRGEKWKEKKSTLLSFKLKNQKNVFPSASLPLRGARRGGLCPAGTCSLSLSLSLSHSRRFHLRVGLAPPARGLPSFPTGRAFQRMRRGGFYPML